MSSEWLLAYDRGDYEACHGIAQGLVEPHPIVLQLWPAIRQRLRGPEGIEEMADALLPLCPDERSRTLLEAAVGRLEPAVLLADADDEEKRCAAFYHLGLGCMARGNLRDAIAWMSGCARFRGRTLEAALARKDIDLAHRIAGGRFPFRPLPARMPRAPEDPEELGWKLLHRSRELHEEGRNTLALTFIGAAHAVTERYLDDEDPTAMRVEAVLGECLRQEADFQRAVLILEPLLEDSWRLFGQDDPLSLRILRSLAGTVLEAEAWQAAESWHRHWRGLQPESAEALHGLAHAIARQDRHEEAWPLFRDALEAYQIPNASCHHDLGASLAAAERLPEAGAHLRSAVAIARQGEDKRALATFLVTLGGFFLRQERFGETEKHWVEAAQLLEGSLGSRHDRTRAVWRELGALYRHTVDAEKMLGVLQRLVGTAPTQTEREKLERELQHLKQFIAEQGSSMRRAGSLGVPTGPPARQR